MHDMCDVIENYKRIDERVKAACERCGRDRDEVTLIAVSKTKPDYMVEELYAYGVRDFGENKPQELQRKHEGIRPDGWDKDPIRWHMIGNIQTNKVKMFTGQACLIHSVPGLHVAQAISKEAVKCGVTAHILIEVNVAGEATKHGLVSDGDQLMAVAELVRQAAALPAISVDGLMQIAPPVEDPEENRLYFKELRRMRDAIRDMHIDKAPMTQLSMGMTGDFEVAVEEGATFVRVGTAIFGARDYSK